MPRGRPKGSLNKSTLIKMGKLDPVTLQPVEPKDSRTDDEVIRETIDRFEIFNRMVNGTIDGTVRSLIVSGASGVGKSYSAEWILNNAQEKDNEIRFTIKSGAITGIELYKLAYTMRHNKHIIVLDDTDSVFSDEDAMNVLKACLDTSIRRKVSWLSNSSALKVEGEETPREFDFEGTMVFLTNRNFQAVIDGTFGSKAGAEHMQALMSRSLYLDLKMHTRREITLWTKHIVLNNKILQKMGLSESAEKESINWIVTNMDNLREISIRTAMKLATLRSINPVGWKSDAAKLLLK